MATTSSSSRSRWIRISKRARPMTSSHRPNLSLAAMDQGAVFHPMTELKRYAQGQIAGPRIIDSGSGVYVVDRDGRRCLDGFGGLYCVNIGYGRAEMVDAIAAQA